MKKNGFTLIELVVAIVILGILAVTAAPRFLNLQADARNASLEGLKGAIESGIGIGYTKLAIEGLESLPYVSNHGTMGDTPAQSLPIPGCELFKISNKDCTFLYGYPDAEEYTLPRLVENLEGDSDWVMLRSEADKNNRSVKITFKDNVVGSGKNAELVNENCYLHYTAAIRSKHYQLELIECS